MGINNYWHTGQRTSGRKELDQFESIQIVKDLIENHKPERCRNEIVV